MRSVGVGFLCIVLAFTAAGCGGSSRLQVLSFTRFHVLTVTVRGHRECLRAVRQPPLGRITRPSDHFELRTPPVKGSHSAGGRLLKNAKKVVSIDGGCAVRAQFWVTRELGRFSFADQSNGAIWFGFNSRDLPKRGWKLTITERDFRG
jgi:hypothetical protein